MKRLSVYLSVFFIAAFCLALPAAVQAQVPAGEVFRQEGIASWYGAEFDGRPTASGEIFDSMLFTAAHRDLPFGTILVVTNQHNNRQVTVKVNDRGPFIAGRIVDVSRAAAAQLEMVNTGTAPVIIESIDRMVVRNVPEYVPQHAPQYAQQQPVAAQPQQPLSPPPQFVQVPVQPPAQTQPLAQTQPQAPVQTPQVMQTPPPVLQFMPLPPPETLAFSQPLPTPEYAPPHSGAKLTPALTPAPNKKYKLQVGSYKVARNAVEAFDKLKNAGLNPSYERNGEYFRVVLAGVRGNEVQSTADKLESAGFREALIREE